MDNRKPFNVVFHKGAHTFAFRWDGRNSEALCEQISQVKGLSIGEALQIALKLEFDATFSAMLADEITTELNVIAACLSLWHE